MFGLCSWCASYIPCISTLLSISNISYTRTGMWLRYAGCALGYRWSQYKRHSSCLVCFGILYWNGFSSILGGWRWNYGIVGVYSSFTLLGRYLLPESSGWLALHHRRTVIASLWYVTPHPTTTEMQTFEDFVIKSTLSTSLVSSLADDYQRLVSRWSELYFSNK